MSQSRILLTLALSCCLGLGFAVNAQAKVKPAKTCSAKQMYELLDYPTPQLTPAQTAKWAMFLDIYFPEYTKYVKAKGVGRKNTLFTLRRALYKAQNDFYKEGNVRPRMLSTSDINVRMILAAQGRLAAAYANNKPLLQEDRKSMRAMAKQMAALLWKDMDFKNNTLAQRLKCTPRLKAKHIIRKKVILGPAATGVTLDCKGGTLHPWEGKHALNIISVKTKKGWEAPTDVTVKNCHVDSGIRLWGATGDFFNDSWKKRGHTKRMQAVAPRQITFDNIHLNMSKSPQRGVAIYMGHGVNHVTLKNSVVKGNADLGIYMSAESGYNRLLNNVIATNTLFKDKYCKKFGFLGKKCVKFPNGREQIALDGSANNVIEGNRLSGLSKGGIFMYRNCGENGFARHQVPHHNRIEKNFFYYNKYKGRMPAVWLSSRDGSFRTEFELPIFGSKVVRTKIGYCNADSKYKIGSGKDNNDHAHHNVVVGNTHSGVGPRTFVRQGGSARNNKVANNRRVN